MVKDLNLFCTCPRVPLTDSPETIDLHPASRESVSGTRRLSDSKGESVMLDGVNEATPAVRGVTIPKFLRQSGMKKPTQNDFTGEFYRHHIEFGQWENDKRTEQQFTMLLPALRTSRRDAELLVELDDEGREVSRMNELQGDANEIASKLHEWTRLVEGLASKIKKIRSLHTRIRFIFWKASFCFGEFDEHVTLSLNFCLKTKVYHWKAWGYDEDAQAFLEASVYRLGREKYWLITPSDRRMKEWLENTIRYLRSHPRDVL